MSSIQTYYIICHWKVLLLFRSFRHDFLQTPQGKATVFLMLISLPALAKLLYGGFLSRSELSENQLAGVLLWGHLSTTLCFSAIFPLALAKVFVTKGSQEPLLGHPMLLPKLAVYRFLFSAYLASLVYLIFFFYIFYRDLLNSIPGLPAPAVLLHCLFMTMYLFVIAVPVAMFTRRLLQGPKVHRKANLLIRLGVFPFLLFFCSIPGVPLLLERKFPEILEAAGSRADLYGWWLQVPLAVTYALAQEKYLHAAFGLLLLVSATLIAGLLLRRWLRVAPREIILDSGTGAIRIFDNAFTRERLLGRIAYFPAFRLFWIKDILLPYLRYPSHYAQEQLVQFAILYVFFFCHYYLGKNELLSLTAGSMLRASALLAVAAVFPFQHCLHSLGMEGIRIGLLRPMITPTRLWMAKSFSVFTYCTLHSLVYAALIVLTSRWMGFPAISLHAALGLVLLGTILFVAVGTTLGFFFPDFNRKAFFLPGASNMAKNVYTACALLLIVAMGALSAGHAQGLISSAALIGSNLIVASLVLGGCSLFTFWSLHRLGRMEL